MKAEYINGVCVIVGGGGDGNGGPRHVSASGGHGKDASACASSITFYPVIKLVTLLDQRDSLLDALKEASAEFKKLPHSLGYEITHTEKYDALIADIEATK